jgi:hypothetical protein
LGVLYRSLNSWLCSFFLSLFTSFLIGPNNLLNTRFSKTLRLRSSLNVRDRVSHPYKTTGKTIVLYTLICVFLRSCHTWHKDFYRLCLEPYLVPSVSGVMRDVMWCEVWRNVVDVWRNVVDVWHNVVLWSAGRNTQTCRSK